jgi:LVIVD repeat
MPRALRLVLPFVALAMLVLPATAAATHETFPRSANVLPLGESPHANPEPGIFNSDIAFWRNYAVQGLYDGFRIIDISNPAAPAEVSRVVCGASQGDITISPDGNTLVRSQDSARILPGNDIRNACDATGATPPGTPPGMQAVDLGWEGLQVFDISDKANPRFLAAVATDCGSHTHTQYFDRANDRLIIYVSRSGGGHGVTTPYGTTCDALNPKITAVEVPLANPAGARVVNNAIAAGTNGCHDVDVYEGLQRMYGACRPYMTLWDITDPVNPTILHTETHPAVFGRQGPTSGWHTAGFSWNGRVLIAGWEPGGGGQPECEATDPTTNYTYFFYRGSDGALIGSWTLPRPQSTEENCTLHNQNTVPFVDRHILVQGSYQSGWSIVDFTSPSAAREIAWVDPPPLVPTQLGGDWSTHWYNDLVYESDITRGVAVWDVAGRWWDRAINLPYLNPQTLTQPLRCTVSARGSLRARQSRTLSVRVRVNGQPGQAIRVRLFGGGAGRTITTGATGRASVTLRPSRAGTLRVSVRNLLNMTGCSTSRPIAAPRPGVAAGLTGRPA